MSATIARILAIFLYLIAAGLLSAHLTRVIRAYFVRLITLFLCLGAVSLHGWLLYLGIVNPKGLNLGFFHSLTLVAWVMALLLLIASIAKPLESLNIGVLSLAALTLILDGAFPSKHIILQQGVRGLDIHILISILASSVIAIAALHSVLFGIQEAHLHAKHPGGFIRFLPPLQTMETLLFQMIWIGFILLSLALLTGLFYLEDIFSQHLAHKTIFSLVAWLVFAVLLWGRWRFGWRGRSAIRWTLSGFLALMLAYFGSKLVLEIILGQ